MTEQEAYGQAFENGRKVGDAEGYARGKAEAGKSGKWEPHPHHPGFDRCSECRDCIISADWADSEKWNYCPNCGARMTGDGDG
jgi:hypothetical protein